MPTAESWLKFNRSLCGHSTSVQLCGNNKLSARPRTATSRFSVELLSAQSRFATLLPIRHWLSRYERSWLPDDLIAGATLAAYGIPISLAYAALAGLPLQMGLYCYLIGGLGYAVLGSSRHLAIGPTAGDLATARCVALGPVGWQCAVSSSVVFFLALLLRLSVIVKFISESILTGFKAGAALVIAATQLPKLLGVHGEGDDFFERIWTVWQQIGTTNGAALAIGAAALALLLCGESQLPGRPVARKPRGCHYTLPWSCRIGLGPNLSSTVAVRGSSRTIASPGEPATPIIWPITKQRTSASSSIGKAR